MHAASCRRWSALGLALAVVVGAAACGRTPTARATRRVLDRYRKVSAAKPLPASGMMRVRLSTPNAEGRDEILWQPFRYREAVSSAGWTMVRGIESGRAYFIDQDGVTRVVSDQVLRELTTRSYFWRRAWLFEDRERAWLELGPSDAETTSLDLTPQGGERLRLIFSNRTGLLLAARAPRFALEFATPTSWRDLSDPAAPADGTLEWVGLPTGPVPEAYVGGSRAAVAPEPPPTPYERRGGALIVPAVLAGIPVRLAVDAAADGPVALSPELAAKLAVPFKPDVLGRDVASGVPLSVAGTSWPALWIQRARQTPPGADAVAGGCLFRETVVELDPGAGVLRLHDPAHLATPEGYFRVVIDDDGDRPVAIVSRGKADLRLAAGSDTGTAALVVAGASAARVGISGGEARGFAWGPVRLPPLPVRTAATGFFPDWGDDGLLGYPLLLRFHVFVNMPQRWIYLKPLER
ncbi:MAG TPA: hypothetical protein VMN82_10175 [Thermoanaerobaculia bacterium]|nr:hypothetical protein [Thermoanaerobaculia bacterium]